MGHGRRKGGLKPAPKRLFAGLGCPATASSCDYNCICEPLLGSTGGWSGNQCQCPPARVKGPNANPCKHGTGKAVFIGGKCSWTCDCSDIQWTGKNCDVQPQKCKDPSYCKSGGTCRSITNSNTGQTSQICACRTGLGCFKKQGGGGDF